MSNFRIAVCIHLYYEDMWFDIHNYIQNIKSEFDLFITCRPAVFQSVKGVVKESFPTAEVVSVDDFGMDVIPFLKLVSDYHLDDYNVVLKLHTKNRKTPDRAEQGRIIFEGLCGTPELCDQIVKEFKSNEELGMVGPALMLRSADKLMYGNRSTVRSLLDILGYSLTDWHFFAGTMFWIRGVALKRICGGFANIVAMARYERAARSGEDGTVAHSMERLFGALSVGAGLKLFVTERATPGRDQFYLMAATQHGPVNSNRYTAASSTIMLKRSRFAAEWCALIEASGEFNYEYYNKQAVRYAVSGMNPVLHFVLYGDFFYLDPTPNFSVTHYLLSGADVGRSGVSSLAHYIMHGKKEGRTANPSDDDWIVLAKNLGLFDPQYYRRMYRDCDILSMRPEEHYKRVGHSFRRKLSKNFDPRSMPSLRESGPKPGGQLVSYLRDIAAREQSHYDHLIKCVENRDFEIVPRLVSSMRNEFGDTRALNEIAAITHTLGHNWAVAEAEWTSLWRSHEANNTVVRFRSSVVNLDSPTSSKNGKFRIAQASPVGMARWTSGRKVCIYTTLFGERDELPPVVNPVEGVDYICFTDRDRDARGWTLVVSDPGLGDNNLNAKTFKVLPHRYLDTYEYSLFVDANTLLYGRIAQLLSICLASGPFVMWQHPFREDIYSEAAAIISFRRHPPQGVIKQVAHYASEGMPQNSGLAEACFIWRQHTHPSISEFMEQWWSEIRRFTKRDQLSLSYLMWKRNFRPSILPDSLGSSRSNPFSVRIPHKNSNLPLEGGDRSRRVMDYRLSGKRPHIVFLYAERYKYAGSTVMRGDQLSMLTNDALGGEVDVSYTSDTSVTGALIILTKGFLKTADVAVISELRKRNTLIADYVDEPPNPEIVGEVDALMAASLAALRTYFLDFHGKRIFNVTHHVDLRLPAVSPPSDIWRPAYFGELANTVRGNVIAEKVDFVKIDTSVQSDEWMAHLNHYNFHYAVRKRRGIDGSKPFLKGFTAAHCGANMLIQRDEGDALLYLGHDYPYLLPTDCSESDIVDALERVKSDFGSAQWRYGLEVMAEVKDRSSMSFVKNEVRSMIKSMLMD